MSCQVRPRCHIDSLPVELLSYIFTLATHDCDSEEGHAFSPESVTLPTVLVSVNSQWRNVALSVPTLWSTLSIDLKTLIVSHPNHIFDFRQQPFDQLLNSITRSKRSSLDIFIDARDPKSRELAGGSAVSNYFPLRSNSGAPRLEFIKLKRSNDFYYAHAEQFLPPLELDGLPFAILTGASSQDVTEQDQSGASDQDVLAPVPAPCHPLPKLRHVDIFGVLLKWAGFLRTLGVGHCIQSLELSYHNRTLRPMLDQFLAIINACPLLRRLVIRESGPVLSQPYHRRGVISLPMLEELHLGYVWYAEKDSLIVLLSCLDAPNLVTLSIEDVYPIVPRTTSDTGINVESLLSYCATGLSEHPAAISRTSVLFPKLQRLSLNRVHASITAFSTFMSAFSKLRHLSLLRTPNALAALLLDANATIPRHAITSILVSPVTQPEFLELKQLKNVDLVLTGDVEELSPSTSYETMSAGDYYDWAAC
ncbi:hypothetical protein F4604DRAFT_1681482 [Suillus subluteus]|nr:hypothetical protein F4604DRAFT_1681482 [Suillus subluteus]